MLTSVLIANRGEIAVRIIGTLQRLGVRAIAVHSDADADAPHTRRADVAVRIGPEPAADSYLDIDALLDAAARTGAEAVHPGYGFLAESAAFAQAVLDAGLVWVGPPPAAITAMGDKITAKRTAADAGVPVVPGVHEPDLDDAALLDAAGDVGFPLLVKAAAGGGGKGMRRVDEPAQLVEALGAARRESAAAFGSDALLLERLIERPRHLEVQVLCDTHGHAVHLGERECSLQRRHQKIVEEAPSPVVGPTLRAEMGEAALRLAAAVGYTGAGTVELVAPLDRPADWCFLEMNTRLQVEHPVTEAVTGVDLVEQQLRVAAGEPLGFTQESVTLRGHAMEARVYAEDPARGFLPTGGVVLAADQSAAGCRVDTGVTTGDRVTSAYDPMLAKVVAHGADRDAARRRLRAALADVHLLGVTTNVAFLRALLAHPAVAAGMADTGLVERELDVLVSDVAADPPDDVLAAAELARRLRREPAGPVADPFAVPDGWRIGEAAWTPVELVAAGSKPVPVRVRGSLAALEVAVGDGPPTPARVARADDGWLLVTVGERTQRVLVAHDGAVTWVGRDGHVWALQERAPLEAARTAVDTEVGPLVAPMPGTVTEVRVEPGAAVVTGQTLLVVEAMKMHHAIAAPTDGTVTAVHVAQGQRVAMEQPLAEVAPDDEV